MADEPKTRPIRDLDLETLRTLAPGVGRVQVDSNGEGRLMIRIPLAVERRNAGE